jgi:MFS family permease
MRKNKTLLYLFFSNFVIFFIGTGLYPILPLYASQFGATPTLVGVYFALIYASISAGTMLAGWLVARLTRKGAFIGAGVLGVPALVLLGQATALWQVVLLTGIVWFSGGVGTALVSVFTGLHAGDKSRGKSFGMMYLASPLASVIGGITVGQLVAWQGYPLMFAVLAGVWAGWPLLGLLVLKDKPSSAPARFPAATPGGQPRFERAYYVVLLAVLLSTTTVYISRLGVSLSMQTLNFSPRALASTASVGGLITIPLTFLMGTLSDRLGRKGFLILGYLLAAAGSLSLGVATQLWHFWLVTILLLLTKSVNGSVAAAFTIDLLDRDRIGRGLPWLNAMNWLSGILGSAGAGFLMDSAGPTTLYLIAAALPLLAVALLGALPGRGRAGWQARLPRLHWRSAAACN